MNPSCQAESGCEPDSGVYALLIDGTTVLIRQARPQDEDAVRQMHAQMSPENMYLRFFSLSKLSSAREARRVTRPAGPGHCALLAWLGDRLVGVATYEPAEPTDQAEPADQAEQVPQAEIAELAFAVTDDMHGRGVATLLLDHLVSIARLRGVRAFTAQTLAGNAAMLRVLASAGLAGKRHVSQGVVDMTFPLPVDEANEQLRIYLDSVAMRERQADVASLRYLLRPSSVAIVGASRNPTGVGHAILRDLLAAGFRGPVFAINPNATSIAGVPSVSSAADLPEPPDLAVIALPAASVVPAARDLGRAGARSAVVITAGVDADTGAELLATCRRFGMRLVGPNCFGVAVPGIGLNATFAGASPPPGTAGLIVQSGGIGIAVLEHLSRLGIGVSSFASVGDKYDVSSNDMLMWWEQDEITRLAILYVESFGSPRRFAKTARRVSRQFPVLTVIGGRSAVPPARPLFRQAGVIATTSLGELVDAAAMLYSQPLPRGDRIGIVTNAGGAGVLAADACDDNDLKVAALSPAIARRLLGLLPSGAVVAGPVDATATVCEHDFKTCLELVASDENVDAVLAVTVRTALGDLSPALVSASIEKPLAAVRLDQQESVTFLRPDETSGDQHCVPAYLYPEAAAAALGHAARYGAWRGASPGVVPEITGIDAATARDIVDDFLAGQRLGGWLPRPRVADLLGCYGIRLAGAGEAPNGAAHAVELRIEVTQEPVFGPLVVFGIGGELAEVLDDRAARLAPLTDVDAETMIRGIRAAPLLLGERGAPPVSLAAIADLLHRVSRLADDLAEVAELTLAPVLAHPAGAVPADAKIRLVPAEPQDPFLRRLR